jgi:hypothetical protein
VMLTADELEFGYEVCMSLALILIIWKHLGWKFEILYNQ